MGRRAWPGSTLEAPGLMRRWVRRWRCAQEEVRQATGIDQTTGAGPYGPKRAVPYRRSAVGHSGAPPGRPEGGRGIA